MTRERGHERGLTLTEVTVVMVLAGMVMTGLVGFYLSSQTTWLDGSMQAIAQREANLVLETIRRRAQGSAVATMAFEGGTPNASLAILARSTDPPEQAYVYWWSASDSLIHEGRRALGEDRGPMLQSKVERFSVTTSTELVRIPNLTVRTPQGRRITLSTSVRLMNGGS